MWILSFIVIGVVAAWLAGRFMIGNGFGLIGNSLIGVVGAFSGSYLFGPTGVELGVGSSSTLIVAFAGAILLLFIARLFTGRRSGRRVWS